MDEALEVVSVILIPDNKTAKVLQPASESFDFPAALKAAERSSMLGFRLLPIATMRCNQFNAVGFKTLIERLTIIGFVANQMLRLNQYA